MFNMKSVATATALALGLTASVEAANGKVDVIVTLKSEFSVGNHANNKGKAKGIAASLGLSPKHTYGSALFGFAASVPEARLASLRNHPQVASVEIDVIHKVPEPEIQKGKPGNGGGGSNPQTTPWGVSRVGADNNSNEGAGMHVYVLDTGVDSDHADIAGNLGNGFAAQKCKGRSCNQNWDDDHGHGTHVAGSIAAIDNGIDVVGVASEVTIHPVKICSSRGSCPSSSTIAGLDWVVSEVQARGQAAVANLSIGGAGSVNGNCTNSGHSGNDAYYEAYCNARNAGVVVVVAAGNSSADAQNYTPAGFSDAVITVSSAKQGDDWNGFSNWGNNSANWTSNQSAPVAIAAPGGSILSLRAGGGTTTMSGTSMASPHVAGAAALYMASNPQSMDSSAFFNVRSALLNAAESTANWNNTSGYPHDEDFLNVQGM
ncbi:S8 family serine peptidase [Pleionea sp. CnH1-48]|uniref:S8 family serine peptidase n=1 Tax=Pleionea sp. CnH1-48 TaxID=2954494 RepID=UPI002097A6C9|nr:S8 family serine peptidase [Pleionea sp. CnH1-48]MCO7225335.1 S8 family serine peptidase [Pleionea sp. CnH1-48]